MANFNYQSFSEGLPNRFLDLPGSHVWRRLVNSPTKDLLNQLRSFGLSENIIQLKKGLTKPRVFISHRQLDFNHALTFAPLANRNGFDYWLDIEDPDLSALGSHPNADEVAILTAAIIEMALINCSHVLAVMTPETKGSMWVPYEYGRITDLPTVQGRAAAWIHEDLVKIPEYLRLGVMLKKNVEIEKWFKEEIVAWHT